MYGWNGKLLRVDLTNSKIQTEDLSEGIFRKYLGGKGLISYFLLKELDPKVDPLGPDNKLIFATGVLTGVPVAGMCRIIVGAKSPLTNGYGQSEAGGFWGPELKRAGYDAVIIEGKSEKPVYISIKDDQVEIKDAQHIWGKDTGDAQQLIREELGYNARVIQIGIAGENRVKFACILNELRHVNGRNGLGAVMGSKNLRAIAVKGSKPVEVADKDKVEAIAKKFIEVHMKNPLSVGLNQYGTSQHVLGLSSAGILPTRNFTFGEYDKAEDITGKTIHDNFRVQPKGCNACPVKCKRQIDYVQAGIDVDPQYGGPEYETICAFGSLCLNNDLVSILKCHELCNRYGMDSISTGATIAYAIDCFERRLINKEDTNGQVFRYGDKDLILDLVQKIAHREGIGNLLAEGSQHISEMIGPEAKEYLVTVKGQETAMHDPRGKTGIGFGYAFNEFGADHMIVPHDPFLQREGYVLDNMKALGITEPWDLFGMDYKKVRTFIIFQQWWSMFNMAGICCFTVSPRGAMPVIELEELFRAVTGWNITALELCKAGERGLNMGRIFNYREGFTSKDDDLPDIFYKQIQNGVNEGKKIDREALAEVKALYYSMMGWDLEGKPKDVKLYQLDLEEFIDPR